MIRKIADHLLSYAFAAVSPFIKVNSRAVMFFTFQGKFTCNPRYICEALHRRTKDAEMIWVYMEDKDKADFPDYVKTVKFGSAEFYMYAYRAKVWVDNAFNFTKRTILKKKSQVYINTMHGSLGIKRIDGSKTSKRQKIAVNSGKLTDFIISNSDFENMVYRTSFWEKTKILRYGHARNDIIINSGTNAALRDSIRKKVFDFYGIEEDARLAIYAPTFANNFEGEYESLDPNRLKAALEKRFGGTFYILNRLHPRDNRNGGNKCSDNKYVLDGNLYSDIQELMVAVDFGITDYSSWIYDYVLSKKAGMIYAPDVEMYRDDTGFYYPIETVPFPIVTGNDEMERIIGGFDNEEFRNKCTAFIKDKGCMDDGKASARAAAFIMKIIGEK